MTIVLQCENGHKLRVNDSAAGKKVRCPKCECVVRVDDESLQDDVDPYESSAARAPSPSRRQAPNPRSRSQKSKSRAKRSTSFGSMKTLIAAAGAVAIVIIGVMIFAMRKPAADSVPDSPTTDTTSPSAIAAAAPASPGKEKTSAASKPVSQPTIPSTPVAVVNDSAAARTAKADSSKGAAISSGPAIPAGGLHVWDTGDAGQSGTSSFVGRGAAWTHVAPEAAASYKFRGDCVIENEKIWLHIPRNQSASLSLAAAEAVVPVSFENENSAGSRIVSVADFTNDSLVATVAGEGAEPTVACRVSKGKYWVEMIPRERADQLVMGMNSPFVIAPTEFGEDAICDASSTESRESVPIPHENMLLALEQTGNCMSLLTYPSAEQAGTLTLSSTGNSKAVVRSANVKFLGKSVFVSVLPQQGLWFTEGVGKKYSASGQYPINWKPPHRGVWRLAARINDKYYVSDVLDDHFIFACSKSGTLDCLFGYLVRPKDGDANETVTPMSIYRETVGQSKENAYLLETDTTGTLYNRTTKYRDVCNSIDDMKDVWRNKPQTLESDPSYVANLLADCRTIIDRMDSRLHEYEDFTKLVGEVSEKIKPTEAEKEDADVQAFTKALHKCHSQLKAVKIVAASRADRMVEEIETKLKKPAKGRLNPSDLDKSSEKLRDVANFQETQLKLLRGTVLALSDACMKVRNTPHDSLKQPVTSLGRNCRKVLRNRDPEE